jgi:hypothetical protein
MKLAFQKSCDKPAHWPLRSAEVQQELSRVLHDASTALLTPWLATLFDRTLGITVPNTLRHNYIWANRGSWVLTHPLDLAIVRSADVELHPDATLFTEIVPLMHPDCHTPPTRSKNDWQPPGPYREAPSPTLTARQQEPTRVIFNYDNPERAVQVRDRWVFIQRGSGAPDAGLRIQFLNLTGIVVIRTSRRPDDLLSFLPEVGPNLYGGGTSGISLALDYCPYGAETAEANAEPRFGSPLRSLADSQEMYAIAKTMPEDGLFTSRHMEGVQFTPDGRVRWRDADYGHYFESDERHYAFFSLDYVYRLDKTRGASGQRAFGLPEPWRIFPHVLGEQTKRALRSVSETGSREDALAALHTALRTTRGPFTHFSWAVV